MTPISAAPNSAKDDTNDGGCGHIDRQTAWPRYQAVQRNDDELKRQRAQTDDDEEPEDGPAIPTGQLPASTENPEDRLLLDHADRNDDRPADRQNDSRNDEQHEADGESQSREYRNRNQWKGGLESCREAVGE
jgi:hypothetical protein